MDLTKPNGYLYACPGRILFVSQRLNSAYHKHHALQISISLTHQPFTIEHTNNKSITGGAIVAPNHPHQLNGDDGWRALILIDPGDRCAKQLLNGPLKTKSVISLTLEQTLFAQQLLSSFCSSSQTTKQASDVITKIAEQISGAESQCLTKDPRIEEVVQIIHQHGESPLSLGYLAKQARLSESRLSHLFSEQLGISIKRYLLWRKLYLAGYKVCEGVPMTESALDAGFSDSAHFSRTFKEMLGINPSRVFKTGGRVDFILD